MYRVSNLLLLTKPRFILVAFCICLLVLCFALPHSSDLQAKQQRGKSASRRNWSNDPNIPDVELVVASLKAEDTSWLAEYFSHWHQSIYVVDGHDGFLTIPKNKGREAMVYLTYIIDNYNDLPEYMLFLHADRWQWHNDDPDYDGYAILQKLRFEHVRESGYVSLRCAWLLGCPIAIWPLNIPANSLQNKATAIALEKVYQTFFPGKDVPEAIGAPCCAQFAVTREAVQRRAKDEYVKYRDWLLATELEDHVSGRIFEYSWHIIFGKEAVHCPAAKDCYCQLFGLCSLHCYKNQCEDRYTLPPFSNLPRGWPRIGWNGEQRAFTGPL